MYHREYHDVGIEVLSDLPSQPGQPIVSWTAHVLPGILEILLGVTHVRSKHDRYYVG